jgi:hypothetical protein
VGEVIDNKYRYLGMVRSGEIFYIFARLDPYEQAELMEKERQLRSSGSPDTPPSTSAPGEAVGADAATRPRRASSSP